MRSLTLIVEGRFGQAVGAALAGRVEARLVARAQAMTELEPLVRSSAFVGVALWRPYVAEARAIDDACHAHGVPWSMVVLDGTRLVAGPVVSPGHGPCFGCYERRRRSHLAAPERAEAIDAAWAADPGVGVGGFLPGAVALAATGLLLDMSEHQRAAGRVRIVDLLGEDVEETRAVRIHGCPRCGADRRPGARYVADLAPELEEILP